MAGRRDPKAILISLTACVILFVVFWAVSQLHVLERHAYVPAFGWGKPAPLDSKVVAGACAPTTRTEGFPLARSRQDATDTCQKDQNPIAAAINLAAYFALATIMAVAIAEGVKGRA